MLGSSLRRLFSGGTKGSLFSLLSPPESRAVLEQLPPPGSKVLVGMSGGVDSSVSAAILQETGCYEVVGCWMRNWDLSEEDPSTVTVCSQEKDWKDALEVTKSLGIELKEIDFRKEYWCSVWEPTLRAYSSGVTPNPDVMCNKHVKFGSFLDAAHDLGAAYVATGHYARLDPASRRLHRGNDPLKDQSYFLSGVRPSALAKACFPVGSLLKSKVKVLAQAAGFSSVLAKPESQGVCFIGERGARFSTFLEDYLENPIGNFRDSDTGVVLGKHRGVLCYTVGQRSRIAGKSSPYFVAKKEGTDVWVARGGDHPALLATESLVNVDRAIVEENQLEIFKESFNLTCQVRYRGVPGRCRILGFSTDSSHPDITLRIEFVNGESCVAEGQTLTLYCDDRCLGGGVITQVTRPFFDRISLKIQD